MGGGVVALVVVVLDVDIFVFTDVGGVALDINIVVNYIDVVVVATGVVVAILDIDIVVIDDVVAVFLLVYS